MNRHINTYYRKLIVIMLILSVLAGANPCYVSAVQKKNIEVKLDITERNGVSVSNYMIRRGIPFSRGEVYEDDCFSLADSKTGERLPVQTKVLQRYDDGSINWLSCTSLVNLSPYEKKSFVLTNDKANNASDLSVQKLQNGVILKNSIITLKIDKFGICDAKYLAKKILSDKGSNIILKYGGNEYPLNDGSVEIAERGTNYITVKVTGTLAVLSGITVEQIITMYKGSNRIDNTLRYTVTCDTTKTCDIQGLGQRFYFDSGYTDMTYQPTKDFTTDENPLYCTGYMNIYGARDNVSFAVVSNDVERFKGAVSGDVSNGFIYNQKENSMTFAPILFNKTFSWPDGARRTTHSTIVLGNGSELALEAEFATQKDTPEVCIDSNQYINAGIINDISIPGVSVDQINSLVSVSKKTLNRFDEGFIPLTFNLETGSIGTIDQRMGELQFYMWYGYMMYQNPEFYETIIESAESWADMNCYRGSVEYAYGAGRYRVAFNGGARFQGTQPYYGESSGMILTYLMSGDENYKETAFIMAEQIYRDSKSAPKSLGKYIPSSFDWIPGYVRNSDNGYTEYRYIAQAKAMYLASKLFEDEKYKFVTDEMLDWAEEFQEPEGFWHQGIYADNSYMKVNGIIPIANYAQLYGSRSLCEIYRNTGDERCARMLKKFADYLVGEQKEGGWFYDGGGTSIPGYEKNGKANGEFGRSPMLESMATDIFSTVYSYTNDDKYLESLLKLTRSYLAESQYSGLSSSRYNTLEFKDGYINGAQFAQNLTLFRTSPLIKQIIINNIEKVTEWGFDDLIEAFVYSCSKREVKTPYSNIEVPAHVYENGKNKYFYLSNLSGYYSKKWCKNFDLKIGEGGYLWYGAENDIKSEFETRIKCFLEQDGLLVSRTIPVKVSNGSAEVSLNVISYDENSVVIDILSAGGDFGFEIENGKFKTDTSDGFNAMLAKTDSGAWRLMISKGGVIESDYQIVKIYVMYNQNGNPYIVSNLNEAYLAANGMKNAGYIGDLETADLERQITTREFICTALRTQGFNGNNEQLLQKARELKIGTDFDTPLNTENMAQIVVNLEEKFGAKINVNDYGVKNVSTIVPADIQNDNLAVQRELNKITINNSDYIEENIALPLTGVYESIISWKSNSADVVSNNGIVKRPPSEKGDAEVILTATAKRENASASKEFKVNVLHRGRLNYTSKKEISQTAYKLNQKSEQNAVITFDAISKYNNVNVTISHLSSENTFSATSDQQLVVKFAETGFFDALDYNAFKSTEEIPYEKDVLYKFRIETNLLKRTYSAYVTIPDGTTKTLAENFRYRSVSKDVKYFDTVSLYDQSELECVMLKRHSLIPNIEIPVDTNVKASDLLNNYTIDKLSVPDKNIKWLSSSPDIINDNGEVIKRTENDECVSLYGLAKDAFEKYDIDINSKYLGVYIKAQLIGIMKKSDNYGDKEKLVSAGTAYVVLKRLMSVVEKNKL